MKISEMVRPELNYYLDNCNFTKDEAELFMLRSRDITMEECAERMNVSTSTVKRYMSHIQAKIERLKDF